MLLVGKTQTDLDRDNAIGDIGKLTQYLASTDWKAARAFETGQAIDPATLARRESARAQITALSAKYVITKSDLGIVT